jgi:nucleolar GTP-binding protein
VTRFLRTAGRPFRPNVITPFDRELLARRFGDGTLERALLRVRRAEERIRRLERERIGVVRRAVGSPALAEEVRSYYGRLASFVREVDPDLETLGELAGFLRARPRLDPERPTLVVAGFPNVGKSSLVARLSSAKPEVAVYPFTTRALSVGHTDLGFDRLQVVDTPGVLGREGRANPAETEATVAVGRAATLVLFVLDPSETGGYPLAQQEALLERWRTEFPQLPILAVETKADLRRTDSGRLRVSAKTGEGLEELRRQIESRLAERSDARPGAQIANR